MGKSHLGKMIRRLLREEESMEAMISRARFYNRNYDNQPREMRDYMKKHCCHEKYGKAFAWPEFGDELDPPKPTLPRNRYRSPVRSLT